MTKPKTTTEPHKHTCDKCGNPFTSSKVWAKFCSTQCRVNAHQADRYKDTKKAFRAIELSLEDLALLVRLAELKGESKATIDRIVKRLRLFVPEQVH